MSEGQSSSPDYISDSMYACTYGVHSLQEFVECVFLLIPSYAGDQLCVRVTYNNYVRGIEAPETLYISMYSKSISATLHGVILSRTGPDDTGQAILRRLLSPGLPSL
jgi:hypothetical protein